MIRRLIQAFWRWWETVQERIDSARQERLMRQMSRWGEVDWDEYLARDQAADYAYDLLEQWGMLTGRRRVDEDRAWELGRRLRQLYVESERRGAESRGP